MNYADPAAEETREGKHQVGRRTPVGLALLNGDAGRRRASFGLGYGRLIVAALDGEASKNSQFFDWTQEPNEPSSRNDRDDNERGAISELCQTRQSQ